MGARKEPGCKARLMQWYLSNADALVSMFSENAQG